METCQNLKFGEKNSKVAGCKRLQTSKHVCQMMPDTPYCKAWSHKVSSPVKKKEHVSQRVFCHGVLGHAATFTHKRKTHSTLGMLSLSAGSAFWVSALSASLWKSSISFCMCKKYKTHLSAANLIGHNHAGQTEHKKARLLLSHRMSHKQWKEPTTSAPNPIRM